MKEKSIKSKRDVLEFIWEWAEEKGTWAKLLLHEILNTSDQLSHDKLDSIYKCFRKNIGLVENVEDIVIEKPDTALSGNSIKLSKLSKITGLNRLSSDSVIEFSPNLTIIYGENGTGKSGFSRILKDIGYSYETETKLLGNIYAKENKDISAEIEYTCNEVPRNLTWKPRIKSEELKGISVYNNSCVAISLSENRNLVVKPLGFDIFDRISYELDKLASLLENEKRTLETTFDWFESFNEGTVYQDTIQMLKIMTLQEIEKLPVFSSDNQKQLDELEKIYAGTTKELIEKEISELNVQKSELGDIKQNIERAESIFNETQWNELLQISEEIQKLKVKGYGSLEELAKEKGMELYGKTEFESFIKAADLYINTFPNSDNYPDSNEARCIYCNQPLHETASIDLLKQYKSILSDTTQQNIERNEKQLAILINTFKNVSGSIQLHYSSYGQDENKKPIQPEYIKKYNASIEKISQCIKSNIFTGVIFDVDYKLVINLLQNRMNEIEQIKTEKNKILNDIDSEKFRLIKEINILKDKQLFTNKIDIIKHIINNYLIINTLSKNENAFNTQSISTKTTKARKELVETAFSDTFLRELSNLRKSDIKVELNFGTKKGETNIRQRLQDRYILSDILSEGEQKAISLAEFFAELNIDGGISTVVFDDPVNSLDHHIIDEVAKRLIVLSQTRQTVIFTHSILLYNSLLHEIKLPYNKSIQSCFYHTKNQYELCGIITDAEDEINSPKSYIGHLKSLINNTPKTRPEEEVASEGYGYLRSAIELTVEYEILQGTVKRYQNNIALSNFCKLSGTEIDKHKAGLNDIFEKCCKYISAHSRPKEVASTPNMSQLKADFEAYQLIRKVFTNT